MANGHPVAAVIARPEITAAFRNAFSYFNTFGGNPVSAAAALASQEQAYQIARPDCSVHSAIDDWNTAI